MVDVKKIEIPFMMASENMSSEHWIKIAKSVEKLLNDKDDNVFEAANNNSNFS